MTRIKKLFIPQHVGQTMRRDEMLDADDMLGWSKEEVYAAVAKDREGNAESEWIGKITQFVKSTVEHKKITDETMRLILEHVGNLEKRITELVYE